MLFENKVLSLHKIGFTSEKNTSILFSRFALSLHKIGCTSAIPSKLDCVWLALSLNKIDSEPCAICLSFDYGAKDIIDSGYAAGNSVGSYKKDIL